MMKYKTSEDNKDYIVMEDPPGFIYFLKNNYCGGNSPIREAYNSYNKFLKENDLDYCYKDLAIKKDSDLGRYICEERTGLLFVNSDEEITYENVVHAYNISFLSENPVVALLKEMVTRKFGPEISEYILDNRDFFRYSKIKNNAYKPNDSVVYDGQFHRANLYEMNKHKVK